MHVTSVIWEDTVNYRKVSMFLGTAVCDFKCGQEQCQNAALMRGRVFNEDNRELVGRYIENPISQAIVIGGLEPFLQFDEVLAFVGELNTRGVTDDLVIYTGYTAVEICEKVSALVHSYHGDVIIKYGRFLPGDAPHMDDVLGVELASENQYAVRYTHATVEEDATLKVMLDEGAIMPTVAHEGDAGYDVYSREEKFVPAGGSAVFDLGVHLALPNGYYARVSPRSGLNMTYSVTTFGCVIDNGFRGSIKIKLYCFGDQGHWVHVGDRIAQLVVMPYITPPLKDVAELDETARGWAGFGSTGA